MKREIQTKFVLYRHHFWDTDRKCKNTRKWIWSVI